MACEDLGNYFDQLQAEVEGTVSAIPTGFVDLDEKLGGGLRGGELIIVAGRPAMGKTACGCCGTAGPSEAHEIEQGMWWTSLPLCPDCHRGSFNGIHGQQRMWKVLKKDEMSVLNDTIRLLMED